MPGHVRARGKRKDGSTIWQARWRPADNATDHDREERNFKTRREAERWVTARDSDVIRGAYAPARKGETLFTTVLDDLRAKWDMRLEPTTRAGYEAILSRWLIGDADPLRPGRPCRFQSVKVASVTTRMVQEFVAALWEVRAPNTVRSIYGVIKSVMDEAALQGMIPANPCSSVEMPDKESSGIRRSHLFLEGPELRKLADAIPDHWRVPVLLDGSCGLRAGEVWALRRRDIDLLHRELTIRFALKTVESGHLADSLKGLIVGPPKSAASRRRLSIPSGLAVLLEEHLSKPGVRSPEGYAVALPRADDGGRADLGWTDDPNDPDRLVFTTTQGYPVRHNLFYRRVFKPTVRTALPAHLHKFRFHDLRHTCAALSLSAPGGNLALVKERLGHENISTTVDLYGKRVASVDASIAEAVGASIFDAAEPDNVTPLRRAESE